MNGRYSSSEIFELNAQASAFAKWNENEPEIDFVSHAKRCVVKAINEELTEKQKLYFTMYHMNGMPIHEIATMAGVNKSTVSRTLTRATRKIAHVLKYSAPHLMNKQPVRNRRSK